MKQVFLISGIAFMILQCTSQLENSKNQVFIAKSLVVEQDNRVIEKYGLINTKGKLLTELSFDEIEFVSSEDNYFIAKKDGRDLQQYFNLSDGKLLFQNEFEEAKSFSDDGLARVKHHGKWGHINRKGDFVVPPLYDLVGAFSEGLASVLIENKIGFVNQLGQIVIDPKFDFNHDQYPNVAREINSYKFQEGFCPVNINGKYGFIDQKGITIIQPQYDFVDRFYNGRAGIGMKEGSELVYGIIDKTGKQIIEPKFTNIFLAEDYFIGVKPNESSKSERYGFFLKYFFSYYNYDGSFKVKGKFDLNTNSGYFGTEGQSRNLFSEDLAFVCLGDSCGYINKTGEMIIHPKYFPTINNAELFVNGLAGVGFNNNYNTVHNTGNDYKTDSYRPVGVIDRTGKIVIPPVFVAVEIFPTGIIKVIPKDDFPNHITMGQLDRVFYTDYIGRYIWNGYTRK